MTQIEDDTALTDTPPASQIDTRRAALRDLVALATESAATEAELQRQRALAVEQQQKKQQLSALDLEQRLNGLKQQIAEKHASRAARIDEKTKVEIDKVAVADRAVRQRLAHEHRQVEEDVKHKIEQAVWLAESVFEGTQNQLRVEAKKSDEQLDLDNNALNDKTTQAYNQLQRYGMGVPLSEPIVEIPKLEPADIESHLTRERDLADMLLRKLSNLQIAGIFVGARPYLVAILLLAATGAITHLAVHGENGPRWDAIGIAVGIAAAVLSAGGIALRIVGIRQARTAFKPLHEAIAKSRLLTIAHYDQLTLARQRKLTEAAKQRDSDVRLAKEKLSPSITRSAAKRDAALATHNAEIAQQRDQVNTARAADRHELDDWQVKALADADARFGNDASTLSRRHARHLDEGEQQYQAGQRTLEERLAEGLATARAPMRTRDNSAPAPLDWNDPAWKTWEPPKTFASMIRFGQVTVDLPTMARAVAGRHESRLELPPPFTVPAELEYPFHGSLLINVDRDNRPAGIRILQTVMARLLTSVPAGRARFIIIDPVGLGQNFAGFMHLADHDENLVSARIWTEQEQIEQRLANLTEHMETVIQKYLRNEFATIDEYNQQAGELAEPYRFLVIADYPVGFSTEAQRRLASIASTGARCGIFTLIMRDLRERLPSGSHMDEVEANSIVLTPAPKPPREESADGSASETPEAPTPLIWKDETFRQFPLTLDAPPSESALTAILDIVGRRAKEANRVEVSFDTIAPQVAQFWTMSTTDEIRCPVGRMGATRLQNMRLGKGVAQHVLIAGKTGSGKSTLLHALITNLAMWYSPDEVEFYLIDFKKGVEFKTYATHELPHARAIAVESDREFGLSVLQRLDAELSRRGDFFRRLGVQDLPSYRHETKDQKPTDGIGGLSFPILPRTLLIIDEFQEFFSEDDRVAQEASLLLDRLVRQGRAFGIHVLLGSQTIGGSSGLPRTTIGQMAVRIALQTSEADSQLILGDGNSAARLLSRPGEAIYNDAGGLVEGNSPFQVAWLPDPRRDVYLDRVVEKQKAAGPAAKRWTPPIVFEGNAAADITKNHPLRALLATPPAPSPAPRAYLGDPVAIKDPAFVSFRRQSGANLLIVGQQEEAAIALLQSALLSLAAQFSKTSAKFYIMDGTPADSQMTGELQRLQGILPQETAFVEWRAVPEIMAALHTELTRRQSDDITDAPAIFLVISALQRYRALRKTEEAFNFSADDAPKAVSPDKALADLLREGPPLGMHVLVTADTPATLDRTFDRNAMREFDNRILFQMSANDSSNLIDSPAANKLGFHRALAYSEEQGTIEKFRPYALLPKDYLTQAAASLASRK